METLWNKLDLNRPPTNSWRPCQGEFDTAHFIGEINKCLKDLSYQNPLHTEAAVLSRLIYRLKWKFRNDKGLKNMEKINRSLLNYLHLSIEKEFNYLKDNIIVNKNNISLPSKQMFDYVLVKIQGFSKLMFKIENTCIDAAKYFKSRINVGQAWTMSLVAYSIISRIWVLSRYYVKQSCDWYSNLYNYYDKFKSVGVNWLPENYTLPSDLKTWLSAELEERDDQCSIEQDLTKNILSVNNLENKITNDQMNSNLFSVFDFGEKISRENFTSEVDKTKETKNQIKKQVNINSFDVPDVGQKIIRESSSSDVEVKKLSTKNNKKKSMTNLKTIKTKEDLNKLLSLDCYPGLDKLQWNIIKKKVSKAILKFDEKSTDKLPVKKIIKYLQTCIN